MIIGIDSREQEPFAFNHPCKRVTLDAGDYTIIGMEDIIRMERKKPAELWGCLGSKADFFQSQLDRLAKYPVRMLIVEGTLADFAKKPAYSRMAWMNIAHRLMRWTSARAIPVWFLGPRSKENILLVEDLLVSVHDLYRRDKDFLKKWEVDTGDLADLVETGDL